MKSGERESQSPSVVQPIRQGVVLIFFALTLVAVMGAAYTVRWVLLLFLIGLGLGVVIAPAFPFLKTKGHISYGMTAVGFLLFFLLLLLGGGAVLSYLVASEIVPLLSELPVLLDAGIRRLSEHLSEFPAMQRGLLSLRGELGQHAPRVTDSVLFGLKSGGVVFGSALFIIAIALYAAIDSDRYRRGFVALFPAYVRPRVSNLMRVAGRAVRGWLEAQAIVMSCVAAMTSGILFFLGFEHWLAFGLMAGLLDIVPYIGPFLAASILILTALGIDLLLAVWVAFAFFIVQNIEGYLITPLVMQGRVHVPPIYLLTMMLVMGNWFGLVGVFITPPILAVVHELLLIVHIPRMNRRRRPALS